MDRRHFLQTSAALTLAPLAQAQRTAPAESGPLPPAIAALKNRKSEAIPITLAEREHRFARAQELMAQNGMDAILLVGGTSLLYFTGIRSGNSERLFAFILPRKGEAFIVCPAFEKDRMMERMDSVPGGKSTRIYTWQEHESPSALVGKGLGGTGTLGIEEKTPYIYASEIAKANPHLKLVDATAVTAGCREIKSPAELALMRLASSVTLQVYEAVFTAAHPGMTTRDFSNLCAAAYQRVGFQGDASCQTGIYSALPHGSLTPQIIKENEIVLIDDGCTAEGYYSDLSRTFVYGKPTDRMLKVFEVVHKAQAAAVATARPGIEAQVVDSAARKVITDAGFGPDYKNFLHRVGHGIGMDMHEWTYLVRGNSTVIKANMTFSDEPGIYLPGEFGVRLEDDMVITEDGAKLLTPQSNSLTDPFST
ncbi:M24 family metallopeptidase [Granulicella tundricola]|uniref:Peptidase M24 n=1 Tax=Granulicella tundricola (strain ATCC BAA-1859 / DSM 23138 / MP5ACTX9) TaxID=1198114 RepID=E8X5S5_GRATM|nr:Xaa-Pro peptidase family protein [Granulicella tundricola]ADW70809.1 peptidase M24 [Granulicella tundricola MP5ACTX9]